MFNILNDILKLSGTLFNTKMINYDNLLLYQSLINEFNELDTFSIPRDFVDYENLVESKERDLEIKQYRTKREINAYILEDDSMAETLRTLIEKNTLLLGPWFETMEVEKNGLLTQIFKKDNFFKSCPFQHPHYPRLEYSQKLNMKVIEEYYKKDKKICLFWPINGCSLDDSLDPGFKNLSFRRNSNLETFKVRFKMFLIKIMSFYDKLSYPEKLILACVFQQSIGLYINLPITHSIFEKITGKSFRTSISGAKAPNGNWRTVSVSDSDSDSDSDSNSNSNSSKAYVPPHRRRDRKSGSKMKGGGIFRNYQVNVIDKLPPGVNNVNCILRDRIFFTHEIADLRTNHGNRNRIYPTFRLENGSLIPIPNITALEFIEAHRLSNGNFYRSLYLFELLIFVSEDEDEDVFKDNPKFIKLSSKIIVRKSTNKACIMLCEENLENELMWKLLEEDNSDLIRLIYEKLKDESILYNLTKIKKVIKELIDLRKNYESNGRVQSEYFTQLISENNTRSDSDLSVDLPVDTSEHASVDTSEHAPVSSDTSVYSPAPVDTFVESPAPQWQSNSNVSRCTKCGEEFWAFRRKHHCRLCGKIFCYECIDKNFKIHPLQPKTIFTSSGKLETINKETSIKICHLCRPFVGGKKTKKPVKKTKTPVKKTKTSVKKTKTSVKKTKTPVKKTKTPVKKTKIKYKNRLYKVHTGSKGGKYIICNKKKIYYKL